MISLSIFQLLGFLGWWRDIPTRLNLRIFGFWLWVLSARSPSALPAPVPRGAPCTGGGLQLLGILLCAGSRLPVQARSGGAAVTGDGVERGLFLGHLRSRDFPGVVLGPAESSRGTPRCCSGRMGARGQGPAWRGAFSCGADLTSALATTYPSPPRADAAETPSTGCRDKTASVSYFLCCWKSPDRREVIRNPAGKMLATLAAGAGTRAALRRGCPAGVRPRDGAVGSEGSAAPGRPQRGPPRIAAALDPLL